MIKFLILVVIFASFSPTLVFSIRRINRPCKASQKCVDIHKCPFYVILPTNQLRSPSTIQKMRKNFCGLINETTPKVCCQTSSSGVFSTHKNAKLLPTDACGPVSHNKRITEGTNALPGEFPWMARLAYKTESESLDEVEFKCAGTLINNRYVLTAAHCVDTDDTSVFGVRLGEHDISTDIEPLQDIIIEKVTIHPNYNRVSLINDIALLRLASPANTSAANVKPICLPLFGNLQKNNLNGRFLMVTGWGVTETGLASDILLKTSVPVMSWRNCSSLFNWSKPISGKQLCAGGYEGRDSCAGDSGGPLKTVELVEKQARFVQYGIVSYGPALCGLDGRPAIYTSVREYLSWILDNIAN